MDWLLVKKLLCLLVAGLETEDEDDDCNDDTDDDGGGGGDDDVVQPLGAADAFCPDLPALVEGDGVGGDLHLLQRDHTDHDTFLEN